jgi:hypothetical protein
MNKAKMKKVENRIMANNVRGFIALPPGLTASG